jgi:hypothetical protein
MKRKVEGKKAPKHDLHVKIPITCACFSCLSYYSC